MTTWGTGSWPGVRITGLVVILGAALPAHGHGGADGDHLKIGYYYGHDGNFEGPADPPQPATLLVDTHPWELGEGFYPLTPTSGLVNGWLGTLPGFEALEPEEQEFDGHGFYSWLDPANPLSSVNAVVHLDSIDAGFSILEPATLQSLTFPRALGHSGFHLHAVYFVPASLNAAPGQVFTATFHLSDSSGTLRDSEPFTVQFRVVPEPCTLALLAGGMLLCSRRRRSKSAITADTIA